MNIGIDAKGLSKRYAGISIYEYAMVRYFNEFASDDDHFYLFSNRDFSLDFELRPNFHKVIYHSTVGTLGVMYKMGKYIRRYSIDVYWGPEHIIPFTQVGCKRVVTIHDLAILKIPGIGKWNNWIIQKLLVRKSCRIADKVVAISKATAQDVMEIAKTGKQNIAVIYNGDSPYTGKPCGVTSLQMDEVFNKFHVSKPYFLFVGTVEPRKNITTIIKAYNIFRDSCQRDYGLVIAGGLGWRYQPILGEIVHSPYTKDIVMTGYCSDMEREVFYRNAEALLFPSLYEGFGFPIIEAMSVGIPVITSNTSSMPEVGGKIAYYLNDVCDERALCVLMQKVTSLSMEERERISENSLAWARRFSRKECAQSLYRLFHSFFE